MIAALRIQSFRIELQLHGEIIVFRAGQHRCKGAGLTFRANCKRLQTHRPVLAADHEPADHDIHPGLKRHAALPGHAAGGGGILAVDGGWRG